MSLILINSSFDFCFHPKLFSLINYQQPVNHAITPKQKSKITLEQLITTHAFMRSIMELQNMSFFLTFKYINENLLIRMFLQLLF